MHSCFSYTGHCLGIAVALEVLLCLESLVAFGDIAVSDVVVVIGVIVVVATFDEAVIFIAMTGVCLFALAVGVIVLVGCVVVIGLIVALQGGFLGIGSCW